MISDQALKEVQCREMRIGDRKCNRTGVNIASSVLVN